MVIKTKKQLEPEFERYCDRCLQLAVNEYVHRADHSMLRELNTRIELQLEAPCNTEFCQEQCNKERGVS